MVSNTRARANRRNAQRSTGPKTAGGRSRSAQNAFRHGLSLPISCVPAWSAEVERLAREIAGPNASAEILDLARRIAEAQIDVYRARYARHRFLSVKIDDPYYERRADTRKKLAVLGRAIRHLLRPNPPAMLAEWLERYLLCTPQGPHKLVTILSEESRHLLAMDRYERRAISHRKFVIRAYDEARRRASLGDESQS
jgi:hypothetical protein